MEMTKNLLTLPEEILMEILSFVQNRFEAAQVCMKFYELICELDRNRYKLRILRLKKKVNLHKIIFLNYINT